MKLDLFFKKAYIVLIKVNINMRNLQILLETMTRCGGNCSGCALSSVERMVSTFDLNSFVLKTREVHKILLNEINNDIESISVFLGQGDHFLIEENSIEQFMFHAAQMIPDELKKKTVVFITASAIGKNEQIKKKMDLFYDYSLKYNLPFFVQVVFDPKKMQITEKFQDIYIKNILYFKEKCGMTEVTVNIGEDILKYLSPKDFHDFIIKYNFKHIEMNWVINQFTYNMWKNIYSDMMNWLIEWLDIYLEDARYEINFIPFVGRHLLKKEKDLIGILGDIEQSLSENIYIDSNGTLFRGQMGLISNLTPFSERLGENNKPITANKIVSKLLKRESCSDCEYITTCAMSGVVSWMGYETNQNKNECPWDVKRFLNYFESKILNAKRNDRCFIETRFDKNPVQNKSLIESNNATNVYFEGKIK